MPQHPAIDTLQDDLAMASLHNPYPPGSAEAEAFHGHLVHAAQPENMHNYLGRGLEEIIHKATKAADAVAQVGTGLPEAPAMPTYGDSVTSRYD